MPVYIRNYIDHPGDFIDSAGNNIREKPTREEIRDSIDFMVELLDDDKSSLTTFK